MKISIIKTILKTLAVAALAVLLDITSMWFARRFGESSFRIKLIPKLD